MLFRRPLLWGPVAALLVFSPAEGQWRISPPFDQRKSSPESPAGDWQEISPGDPLPTDKFHWVVSEQVIPERIEDRPAAGETVAMRINGGDGGEVWVNGELSGRFDNDHPALIRIAEEARPGDRVRIAIQFYGRIQGGDRFEEAAWTVVDRRRAREPLTLRIDAGRTRGAVPEGIIGLSQGAGLSDYEDRLNDVLRAGGFRWFRMDNVFTNVVRETEDAELVYDWEDFDRRVDFIHRMGATPIFAASYMPQAFDAVDNRDRHSAPRDYGLWEDLCYRASKRCLERGKPVIWWEVWNEANSGWIEPALHDRGREYFRKIYREALGREELDEGTVRLFEAYCKLYRATARGVTRGNPAARVGGPCLASGPWERDECGHCHHGRGFARGLMLFCRLQKLPLDFISWHEYFHPAEEIARQADAFREYLRDFPEFQTSVRHFMLTEWNKAWWPDRTHDHEIGTAWCADGVIRAFLPKGIDRPCFFFVKVSQDDNLRGDWNIVVGSENRPKPQYHMARMFNHLSGQWCELTGGDEEVCAVAAWDATKARLAVILVNFRFRYCFPRKVEVHLTGLPEQMHAGVYRVWTIDATHSNIWHTPDRPELAQTGEGRLKPGPFIWQHTLTPNSVTMIELLGKNGK